MSDQTITPPSRGLQFNFNAPTVFIADYMLRVPLAVIIFQEGLNKFPDLAAGAAGWQVPLVLWTLVAVGEVLAPIGLLLGGLMANRFGDLITRASALAIGIIVTAVILQVYSSAWLLMRFHVLMAAGAFFFALRGNGKIWRPI